MTTSPPSETFQIPLNAAEFYESAFVPAFFAQWAPILCDAAELTTGQRVLDVACGTGIVTRTAADRVAPDGTVVGVDVNESMLTVARRVRPDLDFRQGDAAALPFPDGTFDVALCQMALMFFPDRAAALGEMARVTARGGTVAVAVPDAVGTQVAFALFVAAAARHAGPEAMALLGTYFACGELADVTALAEAAGLTVLDARTHVGTYRAPSVDAFVTTEVESTPLVERMSAEVYALLRADAHEVLAPFVEPDGNVEAPFGTIVVAARRA